MTYFDDMYDAWMANDCKGSIDDYADPDLMNNVFEAQAAQEAAMEAKRQMKTTAEWYSKISGQVPWQDGDRERFAKEFSKKEVSA